MSWRTIRNFPYLAINLKIINNKRRKKKMLVIIICLAACVAAFVASNCEFNRMFAISTIILLGTTIIGVGVFNLYTFSLIIGESAWLRFIYKNKFDRKNDFLFNFLGEAFCKAAAIPFFATCVSLLIIGQTFIVQYTTNQVFWDFFLIV